MNSSEAKAGVGSTAMAVSVDDDTFEAAVRRRMADTGLPERKARFVTAIEYGILPDGDVVTVDQDDHHVPANPRP